MGHHPHVNESETSVGCHETTTEAQGGFRNSYGLVDSGSAFHAPVAVKQCEPAHSNPAHCDYPCHQEKGYLSLSQMAKAQSELRAHAWHDKNGEAKRWVNQHEMEGPTLILFLAEAASFYRWW
jgi:hypothetical protein